MNAAKRTRGRTTAPFPYPPALPREEVRALAERVQQGDMEARDQLIQANVGLVVKVAHAYEGRRLLPLDDLISEGILGLIVAVERYDPTRWTPFSTFAAPWIRKAMALALANQGRLVRLPYYLEYRVFPAWHRKERELAEALGRMPTTEEIGRALRLSEDKLAMVQQALTAKRPPKSIQPWDTPVSLPDVA